MGKIARTYPIKRLNRTTSRLSASRLTENVFSRIATQNTSGALRLEKTSNLRRAQKAYRVAKSTWEAKTGKPITAAQGQLLSGIVLGLTARRQETALSNLNADDPELEEKLKKLWATWGIQKPIPLHTKTPNTNQRADATIRKLVAAAKTAIINQHPPANTTHQERHTQNQVQTIQTPATLTESQKKGLHFRVKKPTPMHPSLLTTSQRKALHARSIIARMKRKAR